MFVWSISLDLPSYAFVVLGEPFVRHVFGTHDQLLNATLFLFLVAGDAHENPPVRESTSGFSFPNVIRGPGLMRTATNDSSAESKFRLSGPRREARRRRVLAMAGGHDDDECRDRPRARDKIAGGRPVIAVTVHSTIALQGRSPEIFDFPN
jgi:hypothetical protein